MNEDGGREERRRRGNWVWKMVVGVGDRMKKGGDDSHL